MSRWKSAEHDGAILTAFITTWAAVGLASKVHTRTPLILSKDAGAAGLDPTQTVEHAALHVAQKTAVVAVIHLPVRIPLIVTDDSG